MGLRQYTFLLILKHWIFWYVFPTVQVKLKWPVGEVRIRQEESGIWDYVQSADPNAHYRPWLEETVGAQGWAWDWKMTGNDVADNQLTLKIRRDKAKHATIAAMRWS